MENATKALLIAAGVLIGVMILSLGVALYYSLNGYVVEIQKEMEENSISKFNTQFLKYINVTLDESGNPKRDPSGNIITDFKVTMQDIVTIANIAYENNRDHNIPADATEADYNENNLYVAINAKINGQSLLVKNIEKDINTTASTLLSNDNGYEYKCSSVDIKISEVTGRVYEINFK